MSHFTVCVIGENPEDQLAPYDENVEVPRYVKYTKQELIEKGKKDIEDYKNGLYAEYLADPAKYELGCTNTTHLEFIKNEFPLRLNWTDEEVYNYEIQYEDDMDEDGNVYSEYNPKSKWDWYSLGGRWTGMLKLKHGGKGEIGTPGIMTASASAGWVDQASIKDIDFDKMIEESYESASKSYDEFLSKWHDPKEKESIHPYFDYGIHGTSNNDEFVPESKDEYLKRHVPFSTFAVVKDGKWYEKGEMGWWGVISDEKNPDEWDNQFKELLAGLDGDTLISIFDCHI